MTSFDHSHLPSHVTSLLLVVMLNLALILGIRISEDKVQETFGSQDCCALQLEGNTQSGIYMIYPFEKNTSVGIRVYCDLETNGGGWTVLQRREEKTGPMERFHRGWDSYMTGFGILNYSHWLGLENMAAITSGMDQELRIEFKDLKGKQMYSAYREFQVDGKMSNYKLHVRNYYNGTAADNLSMYSHGVGFTTKDRDHDFDSRNCAVVRNAAWWYINCEGPNINGLYVSRKGMKNIDAISWGQKAYRFTLLHLEMKVRNRNFPGGCLRDHEDNVSEPEPNN